MTETTNSDGAFDRIQQEARIARTARMLDENCKLKPNQRKDIIERCLKFVEETDYTQNAIARELDISSTTISEILRDRWKGKTGDKHLAAIHNWLELAARRDSIVRNRQFVETLVAQEILSVVRALWPKHAKWASSSDRRTLASPSRSRRSKASIVSVALS